MENNEELAMDIMYNAYISALETSLSANESAVVVSMVVPDYPVGYEALFHTVLIRNVSFPDFITKVWNFLKQRQYTRMSLVASNMYNPFVEDEVTLNLPYLDDMKNRVLFDDNVFSNLLRKFV